MKLLILTFFIGAAMAEVHWDQSGQYRLIDSKPLEYRYEVLEQPTIKYHITGPADADYRISAPVPVEYPLLYRYNAPVLQQVLEPKLGALAVKSVRPFVYSYKQENHGV